MPNDPTQTTIPAVPSQEGYPRGESPAPRLSKISGAAVSKEMVEAGIDAYVEVAMKWCKAASHWPVGSSIVVAECLEAAYLAMEAARAKIDRPKFRASPHST